ncbi:hypothetical protein, partial [Salinispora arenicola]|uniref:hypothetical protein n=1 Tax=Salinispora arenicola TaxID=168697 RepID=UPI0027DD32B9
TTSPRCRMPVYDMRMGTAEEIRAHLDRIRAEMAHQPSPQTRGRCSTCGSAGFPTGPAGCTSAWTC